jgi:pilus assembly protein CpaF
MMRYILLALSIAFVAFVAYIALVRSRRAKSEYVSGDTLTFMSLFDTVKDEISELVKDDQLLVTSEREYDAAIARKAKITSTLKESVDGKDSAKEIVLDLIYSIVIKYCPEEADLLGIVPFHSGDLSVHVKFEVLMYHFKKQLIEANDLRDEADRESSPERKAFKVWVEKYDLARPKELIEDRSKASYAITEAEVENSYEIEDIQLSYTDMASIVATLIFQKYKGFGCIDTVRAMDINGLNIGVSGSILTYLRSQEFVATRSVWANLGGRYLHLRFLDFETVEEIRRVVQLLSRYNSPGALAEKRGFIVNNMYDESRILAVRPPFAEYWAAFIRKFGADHKTLKFLIYKDYISNWELPHDLIRFLMMGQVTSAFTGRQGSGKTTMMTSAIEAMDPRYNLRVVEMAFELNLREHYPERNIMTLQETEFIEITKAQDALKKSDGAISLFGEVATDEVAARMIQTGRVASLFTIFSHHGKTTADTVYALRDSIVAATGVSDGLVAERQVIDVVRIDIHLDYTADGKYFVERISEVIKLPEGVSYPEIDGQALDASMAAVQREYYTRVTDRRTFDVQDLIRYDLATDTYRVVNPPSDELLREMLNCLSVAQRGEFDAFLRTQFGKNLMSAATRPVITAAPVRAPSAPNVSMRQSVPSSGMRQSAPQRSANPAMAMPRPSRQDIMGV